MNQNKHVNALRTKMQEDYDVIAQAFGQSRRDMHWTELNEMIRHVPEGAVVLDVGCGTGRLCRQLEFKHVQYTGIDISAKQLEVARAHCPAGLFMEADMVSLPLLDESVDTVFMIAALHHLLTWEDRRKAIAEALRVLKPGGHLNITVMSLWNPKYWPLFFKKREGKKQMDASAKRMLVWNDLFLPWKWQSPKKIYRYYHAYRLTELRNLLKPFRVRIPVLMYVREGKRVPFYQARNLVAVVQKMVQ